MTMLTIFMVVLILLLTFAVCYDLRNKTACYNYALTTDPPCADAEMMLPRKFFLGRSANSTCHAKISSNSLHGDRNSTIYCCQQRDSDHPIEYCLPSGITQIPRDKDRMEYHKFLGDCTGGQTCALLKKVQQPSDYATLQYECIPKKFVLKIADNNHTTGADVFLYNDKPPNHNSVKCMAYSMNCQATLTIKLVANLVPSQHCEITYSEKTNNSTLNCADLNPGGECQPSYRSKTNYVDIYINMTMKSDAKTLVWLEIEATTNDNVTVACGDNAQIDIPTGCTTAAAAAITTTITQPATTTKKTTTIFTTSPSVNSLNRTTAANTLKTTTSVDSSSREIQKTNSASTVTPSTTDSSGNEPANDKLIIIAASAGAVVILALVVIAVVCRRKCDRGGVHPEESKEKAIRRSTPYSDNESMFCENSIYETDDYKAKVRDSKVKDDYDNVKYEVGYDDPYCLTDGDYKVRDDQGEDRPFGTGIRISRNSWTNQPPQSVTEMMSQGSLADTGDRTGNAVEMSDMYAKVLPKDKRDHKTSSQISEMYAKVVPKADRK